MNKAENKLAKLIEDTIKKPIKYPSMIFPTRTKGMESKQPTPKQIRASYGLWFII